MSLTSDRIKQLRKQHNFTQTELAALVDVNQNSISDYETGASAPTKPTLIMLAGVFQTTVGYLLGLTDDPKGYKTGLYNNETTIPKEALNDEDNEKLQLVKPLSIEEIKALLTLKHTILNNNKNKP